MQRSASPSARTPRPRPRPRSRLGRNVIALSLVSLFTDMSSEMIYPLLPIFLTTTLGVSAIALGAIEGAAETTAAMLKLASGWWSDRVARRKPLVVLGYGIATLARPLVAIAQSAGHVLAIRLTDRVGKGIRGSPRDALIADSVDPSVRGRAFGFHRAADHFGAVLGPLIAFGLLAWADLPLRHVFWMAAIPGLISFIILVVAVREPPRPVAHVSPVEKAAVPGEPKAALSGGFWRYLAVVVLFALGNSTDAFLILRATELGVPIALAPILWALLHVVKSVSSTPGGTLSDRIGRKPLIVAGWFCYAAVYFGLANASAPWHAWALFAAYGVFFGLTEGTEKAFVADLVPPKARGTAFGWYHFAIGIAALPASLLFGFVWDRAGAPAAFTMGAAIAIASSVGMLWLTPSERLPRASGAGP